MTYEDLELANDDTWENAGNYQHTIYNITRKKKFLLK